MKWHYPARIIAPYSIVLLFEPGKKRSGSNRIKNIWPVREHPCCNLWLPTRYVDVCRASGVERLLDSVRLPACNKDKNGTTSSVRADMCIRSGGSHHRGIRHGAESGIMHCGLPGESLPLRRRCHRGRTEPAILSLTVYFRDD